MEALIYPLKIRSISKSSELHGKKPIIPQMEAFRKAKEQQENPNEEQTI